MSPALTIISLNFAPEPTGTAPYTAALARHLASHGWQVKVIAGTPHYPAWQVMSGYEQSYVREADHGVEILHLPHFVPRNPRLMSRLLMEVDFGCKAARVDWGDPDIVLTVSPALFSSGIVAIAARLRRSRPRTAVWVQDLYGRGLKESHASASRWAAALRMVESRVLSAADRTFVIHDRFRRHVQSNLGVRLEAVEVIRNWTHIPSVGTVDRTAVRCRFGWRPDEIVALHAGNMGMKQHLENIIEAARLAEMTQSRVRFVLMGDGNQRARLEGLDGGSPRLQFIDPLPDREYALALVAADILLVNERPGVHDMSVPSKLTSYYGSGRPVLAAVEVDSATAEEVRASGAGRVVPSGRPKMLLEAAESLGADPIAATRLGAMGPRYAEHHLSPESAMRRWDAALRCLLD